MPLPTYLHAAAPPPSPRPGDRTPDPSPAQPDAVQPCVEQDTRTCDAPANDETHRMVEPVERAPFTRWG